MLCRHCLGDTDSVRAFKLNVVPLPDLQNQTKNCPAAWKHPCKRPRVKQKWTKQKKQCKQKGGWDSNGGTLHLNFVHRVIQLSCQNFRLEFFEAIAPGACVIKIHEVIDYSRLHWDCCLIKLKVIFNRWNAWILSKMWQICTKRNFITQATMD